MRVNKAVKIYLLPYLVFIIIHPNKTNIMKNEVLTGEDLLRLQKEKGKNCLTVIVPTHRLFPERKTDKIVIDKALDNAMLLIESRFGQKESESMKQKLQEQVSKIDYDHNLDGLGIYISDNVDMMVKFPFPVKEKIVVNNHFDIRDMLYKVQISRHYFTLMVSEKSIRLFDCYHESFTEMKGKHFPFDYYDDWEYNQPSRGSSNAGNAQMRSFEHDKSTIEAKRFQDFFRQADEYLGDYMVENTPFIITGTDKDLAWFEDVTAFSKQIAGKLPGNFDHYALADLGKKCWPVFKDYLDQKVQKLVEDYREKIGQGLAVSGIQDIWTAVLEGKGRTLLVEKDFRMPGFTVPDNEYFLTLRPPKGRHETLADAVDEIMETMLDKGGDVIFTENGQLADYGGMALISRY